MSQTLLQNAVNTVDYLTYALIGGIMAGFIVDYTKLPSLITLLLGLILMGLDIGKNGIIGDVLEGVGFALTTLGAYDLIKKKISILAS